MRPVCPGSVRAAIFLLTLAAAMRMFGQTNSGSTFNSPKVNLSVDWCFHFATDCGKPAADYFCRLNGFEASTNFAVGGMRPTLILGDKKLCDQADCRGFTMIQCGASGGTSGTPGSNTGSPGPAPGGNSAGGCGPPTVPNAYLTAGIRQPAGWQRPIAIPWRRGVTADDCDRKCAANTSFQCRAFVLEEDHVNGGQCWLSSLDRAGGVTVTPYPPTSQYGGSVKNYWELSACGPGAPGGGQPPLSQPTPQSGQPGRTGAFDCRCPTIKDAYLTASVSQPRGWQRPIGIPWQRGVTADDCYRKCVANTSFQCRAFVLEEDHVNGGQCWLSSLDRAGGVTVTPYPPTSQYGGSVKNYWELDACRLDRQCAAPLPPPSSVGDCRVPTVPNAYLTASVTQPRGWQRPIGIPWQRGVTANDCYLKCAQNTGFRCRAFVLEEDHVNGGQCWLSSLDRASGVTVTPYPPTSQYGGSFKNYWELNDCQPGGGGGQLAPRPSPTPPGPRPAPTPAVGCSDPRVIGFMDEWLARAVPVPAGNYHFDQWARLIGSNQSTSVHNVNQPVDPYTWATRCNYLWSIASSMNSRNLGTMLDYVQRRLAGR